MIKAKLVVVGGETKTKEVNLRLPTVVGRGKESTLIVPHALVSRKHCEIFERAGILIVRDLDSLNGTYINNYRIKGEQPLHPGELLTLGNVTFRAVYGNLDEAETPDDITKGSSTSTPVDLNKTVPVDQSKAVPAAQRPAKRPERVQPSPSEFGKPKIAPPLIKPAPAVPNPAVAAAAADTPKPKAQAKPPVITAKEPKNFDSDEIQFDEFDFSSPDRSISISAIDDLPVASAPMVSFVGKIGDADAQADTPLSGIDAVDFEMLDSDKKKAPEVDSSTLDSFLRKIR
ncbi:MAG: FHA domain-containing protein [Pirellulaceae bacterium]